MSGRIVVYKYPLEVTDHQQVEVPEHSLILCVKGVRGKLCLYVMVACNVETTQLVDVRILGTGMKQEAKLFKDYMYIDTVVIDYTPQSLVWHIFTKGITKV